MAYDGLAFEIELALRGVGKGHRRRATPHMSEMDAHVASKEVAAMLRAKWTLTRIDNHVGHGPAPDDVGTTIT